MNLLPQGKLSQVETCGLEAANVSWNDQLLNVHAQVQICKFCCKMNGLRAVAAPSSVRLVREHQQDAPKRAICRLAFLKPP